MQNRLTKAFQERISEIMDGMGDHTQSFEITIHAAVDELASISYKVDEAVALETLQRTGQWNKKEDTDVRQD